MGELMTLIVAVAVVILSSAATSRSQPVPSSSQTRFADLFTALGEMHIHFADSGLDASAISPPSLRASWPDADNNSHTLRMHLLPALVSLESQERAERGGGAWEDVAAAAGGVCWGLCYVGVLEFDVREAFLHSAAVRDFARRARGTNHAVGPHRVAHRRLEEIFQRSREEAKGDATGKEGERRGMGGVWDLAHVTLSALSQNRPEPLFAQEPLEADSWGDADSILRTAEPPQMPDWVVVRELGRSGNWKTCMNLHQGVYYDQKTAICHVPRILTRLCAAVAMGSRTKRWRVKRDVRRRSADGKLEAFHVGCVDPDGVDGSGVLRTSYAIASFSKAPAVLGSRAMGPRSDADAAGHHMARVVVQLCADPPPATGGEQPAMAQFLPIYSTGGKLSHVNLRDAAARVAEIDVDALWPQENAPLRAPVCPAVLAGNSPCARAPEACFERGAVPGAAGEGARRRGEGRSREVTGVVVVVGFALCTGVFVIAMLSSGWRW